MRRLKHFQWCAVLAMTVAMTQEPASAQEADTLSISGTFSMDVLNGTVGDDLGEVYANANDHGWTLTLHGVTDSYDYSYNEWDDEYGTGYQEEYITRLHATSFDFQFFGPDADVLNSVVSQQLIGGGLVDGAFLTLTNGDWYESIDPWAPNLYTRLDLQLVPLERYAGVSFAVSFPYLWNEQSPTDANGYPLFEPRSVTSETSFIADFRPGNSGGLLSYEDIVNIGSSQPPPPPPLPLPTLSILDGSVREGNRGTTWLDLTVTLSRYPDDVVTVNYQTADGTAKGKSDYTATSGTLLFWPDEISRTISIAIKADRKRENDEDFTVRLSNAVGATIDDGVATATILNDD